MPRDRSFPLLLLCFFGSGLAALVYETSWTREFAFVFGTSELAIATVLAAYMAGLAAGSAIAGRYAHRLTRPVLAYGLLELGIALTALAVPLGVAASRWLYVAWFGGREALGAAAGLATPLFYLVCSFLILLLPTGMMGATLPLLARYAVRDDSQLGKRVGVLYAVNTIGAVAGTVLSAFVLLPTIGLRATILVAAVINAGVFIAAWALARASGPLAPSPEPDSTAGVAEGPERWILPLILASGFVSFTYEVFWVRLVAHEVGSGTDAFSTMLGSFLAGIAIGSAVASRFASDARRAALGFAVAQLGIAAFSVAAFFFVDRIPALADRLHADGLPTTWVNVVACMATLFPAALCIGATFPFAVRILARSGADDAGPASARVYSVNTVGSIAGSVCAGFFLVPDLGFKGTIVFCAVINLALAAAAAVLMAPRRVWIAALAAAGGVALAIFPPTAPWKMLRTSSLGGEGAVGTVTYLGVGRSSTVLVTGQRYGWSLRNNGLPEAGMPRSGSWWSRRGLTRWLSGLPVLARPEARSMLVVGLGGGMVIEVVPKSIERIDVIELEPKVLYANQLVAKGRWRDPLSDPRVRVHLNDARNALLLASERFDAVVSQPSHPWAGGAAHLYTHEFFQLVKSRLSPDGVFVQWIGLPFVDEELFRSLLATLADVFPYVQLYEPPPSGSLLFLSSNAPIDMEHSVPRAFAADPEAFAMIGIKRPEDVLASLRLDDAGVRALARGAVLNRDGMNRLQSRSGRLSEVESLSTSRVDDLIAPFDPLVRALPAKADVFYVVRHLGPTRAKHVAEGLADPRDRNVALALSELEEGKRVSPRRRLDEVLREDPRHVEGRAAQLRLAAGQIAQGLDPEKIVQPPLSEAESAVASGWIARAGGKVEALRALEAPLAAIPIDHPLGTDAIRLRIQARLASGDPELAKEAVDLSEGSLGERPEPSLILLRAEASAQAGDHELALETLRELIGRLDGRLDSHRALGFRARDLARAAPDTPELRSLRSFVLQRLASGVRAKRAR
jgi:spermidine synthase